MRAGGGRDVLWLHRPVGQRLEGRRSRRAHPWRGRVTDGRAGDPTAGVHSVPKVTLAGKDHGHVVGVGGLDDFVVADGSAGLDGRACSFVCGGL